MKEFLDKAAAAYYAGTPIIEDAQFDKLAEIHQYNEVGAKVQGKKNKHLYQLYSLDKWYEGEGEEPLQQYETVETPKLDGAALALVYVEGRLVMATTRGDGIEGQDVTDKFIGSNLVPQNIEFVGVHQITGELVAPSSIENSRNYAAGALNLKDLNEFKTRNVHFVAYGLFPLEDSYFSDDMAELEDQGFITVCTDSPFLFSFPTDGFVMRINKNKAFESLGYTAKAPRGAYAIKTRGEAVETVLLDVVWQVGKSGKVTPVAILEPVMVGDAEVSRATLNNQAYIQALELQIGDTVGIIRAGEIIPQVLYKV